ncbi:hypothetical protein B6D60_03710 [candidate division KSB1 bacterium 4484_87]|nr:MAG: hypothetical protein B6D60_03710 [candidate division KSB1 bacterium 4484_87]
MTVLLKITVLYALALALAFLVERLLEILKSFYDLLDTKFDWYKFWTVRAYKTRNVLENKLRVVEFLGPKSTAKLLDRFREKLLNTSGEYQGELPVISGDLVREMTVRTHIRILGMTFGVFLAIWMRVDLIQIFQGAISDMTHWHLEIKSEMIRYILTGIILGIGSEPVHKLIRTFERRQKRREAEAIQIKIKEHVQ